MESKFKHIFYKYPNREQQDLIPILQDIQNEKEFLSAEYIQIVSEYLNIPASKIYGIATFYNQFRFFPKARHHVRVCSGSACHVMGGDALIEIVRTKLEIQANGRSKSGEFSMEMVDCLGACALAPLIQIDNEFYGKLTSPKLEDILNELIANKE
jgi:NADH:ubiquinone oxidoreductase subunit E